MPPKLRKECAADAFYQTCARQSALHDHVCQMNPVTRKLIEWEHALIFAGNQVQEKYAVVPLCWYVHEGPGKNKDINVWIALNRATEGELAAISKAVSYTREKTRLNQIYGVYGTVSVATTQTVNGIEYPWLKRDVEILAERTSEGHTVIRASDGTVSCNCLSFVYRDSCRHIDTFIGERSTLQLPLTISNI